MKPRRGAEAIADAAAITVDALARRPWSEWPTFVCCHPGDDGRGCDEPATWMRFLRGNDTAAPWFYCARHRDAHAVRIPPDQAFGIVRLDVRIAVAVPPGQLAAGVDTAVRRAAGSLEGAGVMVTKIRVLGQKAAPEAASASPLRLQLAGPPIPVDGRRAFVGAPSAPARFRYRQRRKVS